MNQNLTRRRFGNRQIYNSDAGKRIIRLKFLDLNSLHGDYRVNRCWVLRIRWDNELCEQAEQRKCQVWELEIILYRTTFYLLSTIYYLLSTTFSERQRTGNNV